MMQRDEISTARAETSQLDRLRIATLAFGHLVNDNYTGYLAPLIPLLMKRLDFSIAVAGMLASVQSLSNSMAQPLYGWLNDRLGSRAFVFLGPLVTAVFVSQIGLATSPGMIAVLLFLAGMGTASFHPSAASCVKQVSGSRPGLGMSVFLTAGNFGNSLGPVIVMPVVLAFGFSSMPILILPGLFAAAVLYQFAPPLQTKSLDTDFPGREKIFGNGQTLTLALHLTMAVIRAAMITGFSTFLPLVLQERGYSLSIGSVSITIFIAVGSLGALTGGYLGDRFDKAALLVWSFVLSAPLFAAFLFVGSIWGLGLLLLGGFIAYLGLSLNVVMAQELFAKRAATMSALMIGGGWGLGGLLMTPLGALAEIAGLVFALKVLVSLNVVAIIASILLRQGHANRRITALLESAS